jgi:tetratricopeptide (TPR) repeat protein
VQKYGWEACRQRAEKALEMSRHMAKPPVDIVLRLYSDLGSVATFTNDRTRLLQVSEEGLAFADRNDVPAQSPLRFTLLRNRIDGLLLAGRAAEAEASALEVIAMAEKAGGVGSTRFTVLYSALARALRDQGRYREALAAMTRVRDLLPADDSGPRNVATSLANLAAVHALMGDYAQSLELMEQSLAALERAQVAPEDAFRIGREHTYMLVLLASGERARARARLAESLPLVQRTLGEDSEEYAQLLGDEVELARQDRDAARGATLLAEARQRATHRGVAATSAQFATFLRYDAAFAQVRGETALAEARQREAVQGLLASGNPWEIAVARSELAGMLAEHGQHKEARALLALSLPVMRQSVLPAQHDLKAAETLARKLKM